MRSTLGSQSKGGSIYMDTHLTRASRVKPFRHRAGVNHCPYRTSFFMSVSSKNATSNTPTKDNATGLGADLNPFYSSGQRQRILEWLASNVSQSRIDHILRVETMAIALAEHHQVSPQKAAQAGLMHDLAKFFKPDRLLALADAEGIKIDAVFADNPHLLHADVGAIVARDELGVEDREVLEAIANHTLGTPAMSPLSCIIFLADSLEPGRGDSDELERLRALSFRNLNKAVWKTCDYTIQGLLNSKKLIHPRAIATRNDFLQRTKQFKQAAKSSSIKS